MRWTLASSLLTLAIFGLEAHSLLRLNAWCHRESSTLANDRVQSPFLNERSRGFAVNGSSIPLVDFDAGESYAGLLPLSDGTDRQLYFWFFPSTNPVAQQKKEILIYLTGGPGCSSMGELLQSNGPILWQPGTFQAIRNKWSWHRLTNVVWIDQPVGTGFSQGKPTVKNDRDVAQQFLGFWRNFVDTFALHGYTVYVTASSYGGMFGPFISSAMLDQNDTRYFNVSGMAIWNGLYSKVALAQDILVASGVNKWRGVLAFNESFSALVKATDARCGYTAYLDKYLAFPPRGRQPSALPGQNPNTNMPLPGCALYLSVLAAAEKLNPCLNLFDVTVHCPVLFDPIGFSGGTLTLPSGFPVPYFDLPSVKAALHAPANATWRFCQNPATNPVFLHGVDESLNSGPGSQPVLPGVIERTGNVILGHGARDFLVLPEATLLTIQNLTWKGAMGFQRPPGGVLFIPPHGNANVSMAAGAGVVGSSHVERGLAWFGAAMAGHLVGADQPAVTFRMIEVLLGRVAGLESSQPFTVDMGGGVVQQPAEGMGAGMVVVEGGGLGNWGG